MNTRLLLSWQNPSSRRWLVIGMLEKQRGMYLFRYSKTAKEAAINEEFIPFGVMRDLDKVYSAAELFPIFKNRLLAKSRPEYAEYFDWLGLDHSTVTDMDELARSGGIRATDQLQLFPYPESKKGQYTVDFFVHGMRYMPPEAVKRVNDLQYGDELFLSKDVQNPADALALAIRTEDPPLMIGYCPSFLTADVCVLLVQPQTVKLSVLQVNENAPLQYRLLCNLKAPWHDDFATFADKEFDAESAPALQVAL